MLRCEIQISTPTCFPRGFAARCGHEGVLVEWFSDADRHGKYAAYAFRKRSRAVTLACCRWCKMCLFRDWGVCWVLSIGFELLELSMGWLVPQVGARRLTGVALVEGLRTKAWANYRAPPYIHMMQ